MPTPADDQCANPWCENPFSHPPLMPESRLPSTGPLVRRFLRARLSVASLRCIPVLLFLPLFLVAGCADSGLTHFVSLNAADIDPPPPDVWEYPIKECYWWLDGGGELNVAWRCERRNLLLGRYGQADLEISLVLGRPPAGSGLNYRIGPREARTVFTSAMQNMRLASSLGIVAVTTRDGSPLRGSFRIWMTAHAEMQVFSLLPQHPQHMLCFGRFQAVHDPVRGQAIRTRCESGGWVRPPRTATATTKPATTAPAG